MKGKTLRRSFISIAVAAGTGGCLDVFSSSESNQPVEIKGRNESKSDSWATRRHDPGNTGTNLQASGIIDPHTSETIANSLSEIVISDDQLYLSGNPIKGVSVSGSSNWTTTYEFPAYVIGVTTDYVIAINPYKPNYRFQVVGLHRDDGTVDWRRDVGGDVIPVLVGNVLFVAQNTQPKLLALETATGETRWSVGGLSPEGLGYANGTVVVTNGSAESMVGVDASSGDRSWTVDTAPIYVDPVLDDDTAYGGASDGTLLAVDLESGDVRWMERVFARGGGFNVAAPALCEDVLVVPSDNEARSVGIDIADGSEVWRVRTGVCVAPPATDGDRAYFATTNEGVLAVDVHGGDVVWREESVTGRRIGPSVVGDALYVVDAEHDVVRIW